MRADTLLRYLGQVLSKQLRACKVPDLLADQWTESWALMVADACEDGESVEDVTLRLVQALILARTYSKVYGDE